MKPKKKTIVEKHISARGIAINNSNKSQLKKINQIKVFKPKEQVPLSDFYMYVEGKWLHKGQGCRLCGIILADPIVLDKHRYICVVLNKKEDNE